MTDLFLLSFTGTLSALDRGELTWDELEHPRTLMFFGCSKEHAINADAERDGVDEWRWFSFGSSDKARFGQAVEKACREGRAVFRKPYSAVESDWDLLGGLLTSNGHSALSGFLRSYSYPRAAEWLTAHGFRAVW